jgi:c-di-GMP-binding flagellar brake protein YcgR
VSGLNKGNLVIKRSRNLTITEKRKYQRIKTHNLLSYVCIDDSGNPTEERMGTAIEISQGGLFIETHNPLKPQDVLLITIDIQGELVPIKGRVVHCRTDDSGKFRTGIQFLEFNEKILSFVTSLIKTYSEFINQHG